ncbi:cytochrome B562 [Pasteurellaceae bacterium RH1A]|nr:cytochrome B562 [Pasteurellaceae bacterium RH1A]
MNKLKQLLAIAILAASPLALSNGVMMEMFGMNKQMNSLFKAETAEDFQKSAQAFIKITSEAKEKMPASLDGDEEAFKGYQAGMQEVIDVVANAEKLAAEGKLDEAKETVKRLNELKKTYHQQYK